MEDEFFKNLGVSADDFFSTEVEEEVNESTETSEEQADTTQQELVEDTNTVTEEDLFPSESVGNSEENNDNNLEEPSSQKSKGSSPSFYSSIAEALMEEGVLSRLEEDQLSEIKGAGDFAALMEREIQSKFDERQRRLNDALTYGVEISEVQKYEQALNYLASIRDEHLGDEGEQGVALRKELIYRDYINKGYSEERATRELDKSFRAGTDREDALEARNNLYNDFNNAYSGLITQAREEENYRAQQVEQAHQQLQQAFSNTDDDFKSLGLSKNLLEKAYLNLVHPAYEDPETGAKITAMQKSQKENMTKYLKGLAIAYTLTDGFTKLDNLYNKSVNKKVSSKLKELEKTLSSQASFPSGNLEFVTKETDELGYLKDSIKLDL